MAAWSCGVARCSADLVSGIAAARLLSAPRLAILGGSDEAECRLPFFEPTGGRSDVVGEDDDQSFLGILGAAPAEAARTWGCG